MFSPPEIRRAGQLLADAYTQGNTLPGLKALTPPDAATAEAISDAASEAIDLDIVGWKVGCTSELAMEILQSPGPFAGRVFAGRVFDGHLPTDVLHEPQIECEFAFQLGTDLPARDKPYVDVDEVRAATATVAPAIELVAPRVLDFEGVGYLTLTADHGANGGVVLGEPVDADALPELRDVVVSCEVDGQQAGSGTGAAILGDPWQALLWLAEHLRSRGIGLTAGQFVMSGTCTGIDPLPVGSTAVAQHLGLGEVSITHG